MLDIGRLTDSDKVTTNAETSTAVTLDLGAYYDGDTGLLNDYDGMIKGIQDALNALPICGEDTNSFVVRLVPQSEIEFYKDTLGEIKVATDEFSYTHSVDIEGTTYSGIRSGTDHGAEFATRHAAVYPL